MAKVFEQSFPSEYAQGLSYDCYRYLGTHILDTARIGGIDLWTVSFAVWAPEAIEIHVCGTFNQWGNSFVEGAAMHLVSEGIWYTEISGIRRGDCYYYQITNSDHTVHKYIDPFAKSCVFQPELATVIAGPEDFLWTDGPWMEMRSKFNPAAMPMNIYEVHLGSWMNEKDSCSYRTVADKLIHYLLDMHYTHVSLMSLCEYPFDGSLGYQVGGFYAVTGRYGTPEDFKYLVNRLHEAGIGVLLDWVPGYFVKEPGWLYRFGGTWQYESPIENFRENPYIGAISFDFSKGVVQSFLISNGLYWLQEYHIDGLCVKSLEHILYHDFERAHRVEPKNIYGGRENLEGVSFLRNLNVAMRERVLGIVMIADDRSNWPMATKPVYLGGLGFDFCWNRNWKRDTLEYMRADPVYRSYLHGKMIVHSGQGFSGDSVLPISHQDVIYGRKSLFCKMFGQKAEQAASLKTYFTYLMTHPGKKMLFMGSEFGDIAEWRHNGKLSWDLLQDPLHKGIKAYVQALNYIYKQERSLWMNDHIPDSFTWIDADNASQNVFAFLRKGNKTEDFLLIICNFSEVSYPEYKIGVPRFADYHELIGSEDARFGGSVISREIRVRPKPEPWNGQPFHIEVSLPACSAQIYKPIFPKRTRVSPLKRYELQKKE